MEPQTIDRRELFHILPAAAACLGAVAGYAAAQTASTAKPDMTWEQLFQFTYQKDFIPVITGLAEKYGRPEFCRMLSETVCEVAAGKMRRANIPARDFAAFRANMRQMPPMYRAALQYEVIEDSDAALEYKVHGCLWAKCFREAKAGDVGSAYICAADFAIASAFNPKLKLERPKTLMAGDECCHFRYSMDT